MYMYFELLELDMARYGGICGVSYVLNCIIVHVHIVSTEMHVDTYIH